MQHILELRHHQGLQHLFLSIYITSISVSQHAYLHAKSLMPGKFPGQKSRNRNSESHTPKCTWICKLATITIRKRFPTFSTHIRNHALQGARNSKAPAITAAADPLFHHHHPKWRWPTQKWRRGRRRRRRCKGQSPSQTLPSLQHQPRHICPPNSFYNLKSHKLSNPHLRIATQTSYAGTQFQKPTTQKATEPLKRKNSVTQLTHPTKTKLGCVWELSLELVEGQAPMRAKPRHREAMHWT